MPTINEGGLGPLARLLGLLAAIRWEAQFMLAKCCMTCQRFHVGFGSVAGRARIGALEGLE